MPDNNTEGNESTFTKEDLDKERGKAQRLFAEVTDLKKQIDKFKDIDPEKYKGILEDYELLKQEKASTSKDPEEIKKLITQARVDAEEAYKKTYGKKIEELQGALTTSNSELKKLKVIGPGLKKAAELHFFPESMRFVEREIAENCAEIDGELFAVDADGAPRRSPTDPRRSMTMAEYLEDLATTNPYMVQTAKVSGAKTTGTKQTASNGALPTLDQLAGMSKEQIDKIPVEDLAKIVG